MDSEVGLDGITTKEQILPEEAFIQELLERGVIEINTPTNLGQRKFVLSYRSAPNPNLAGPIDRQTFVRASSFFAGYSSAHAIDLFEVMQVDDQEVYVPIGHRDYDLVRFTDGVTMANGNFSRHRNTLTKNGPIKASSFNNPYELADNSLGASSNGVDILDLADSSYAIPGINAILEKAGVTSPTWRGHGLGHLLTGVGIEILRKQGVDQIEFGSVSPQFVPIIAKAGFTQGSSPLLLMKNIPQATTQKMFSAFVPQRLS